MRRCVAPQPSLGAEPTQGPLGPHLHGCSSRYGAWPEAPFWRAVRKAKQSLVPLAAPEAAELVTCTSALATIWFWALLQDFADLQDIPTGWDDVQVDHPCIGVISSATGDAEPLLCLNRPVA